MRGLLRGSNRARLELPLLLIGRRGKAQSKPLQSLGVIELTRLRNIFAKPIVERNSRDLRGGAAEVDARETAAAGVARVRQPHQVVETLPILREPTKVRVEQERDDRTFDVITDRVRRG